MTTPSEPRKITYPREVRLYAALYNYSKVINANLVELRIVKRKAFSMVRVGHAFQAEVYASIGHIESNLLLDLHTVRTLLDIYKHLAPDAEE